MDFRIGLLLLLAYASGGAWCATSREGPPRHHHHHHHHNPHRRHYTSISGNYHNHHHHPTLQRQVRALSEFLVPPPVPSNFRGPRGPPPPPSPPHPSSHPAPQLVRTGRYVSQGNDGVNSVPGYFTKLMSWLSPFDEPRDKDSQVQAASNYQQIHQQPRLPQYAPHQPYTSATSYQPVHYQPPAPLAPPPLHSVPSISPSQPANLAAWMSSKTCNPCNESPWIPIMQYAPNAGSNAYLPPVPSHDFKTSDYSPPSHQQPQYNSYPGVSPPLYDAKPFNDPGPPADFTSIVDHSPSHQSNGYSNNNNQNNNHYSGPIYDEPPSPVYNPNQHSQQQSIELDHPPSSSYEDHHLPPSSDFDSGPPSSSLDYHSQSSGSYDEQHHQPSQTVNVIKEPPSDGTSRQEPEHAESRPVFIATSSSTTTTTSPTIPRRQPSPRYSQNGPTLQNVYFQRSPLIDLSVAGESTTIATTTTTFATTSGSVVTTASYRGEKRYKPITIQVGPSSPSSLPRQESSSPSSSATVIDYIVSSPDHVASNEVDRETTATTRPPPPPRLFLKQHSAGSRVVVQPSSASSSTTTTTTEKTSERKGQGVRAPVQSYEFYGKKSGYNGTSEERPINRPYNETDDYSSASREVVRIPDNLDNGKKNKQIIQIIIPYTSQYTPSPFHPTKSVDKHVKKEKVPLKSHRPEAYSGSSEYLNVVESDEDNVAIEESRRVPVTRSPPPEPKLRNANDSRIKDVLLTGKMGNTIDVHRLQKNIDNWTIQEYSKSTKSATKSNSTYPRWLSSKQIPDEYLLSTTELEESSEYYDYSNETKVAHRGTHKLQATTQNPETVTKVEIINATYPRKPEHTKKQRSNDKSTGGKSSGDSERVYVVTPIPNPNSLEDLSHEKSGRSRRPKIKEQLETSASSASVSSSSSGSQEDNSAPVERAYQVLPQAVNNLAVLSNAPESAAPALWGIMEHEEFAASANQPRWRSEADVLPEPVSTPILYAGHSKVSRAR